MTSSFRPAARRIWDRLNPVCIYDSITEFWLETQLFHFTITEKSRSNTTENGKVNSELYRRYAFETNRSPVPFSGDDSHFSH